MVLKSSEVAVMARDDHKASLKVDVSCVDLCTFECLPYEAVNREIKKAKLIDAGSGRHW